MSFLAPIAFAALAVPLVMYLVHWLFGARRRQLVPALFLWLDLPAARSGRRRRRLPPFSWLLALQLAAAALAVFGLARPTLPGQPQRHVALILDGSASMQATDVAPSRFEAARRAAVVRIQSLRADDRVTVIGAGKTATLETSGTPSEAAELLREMQPGRSKPAIREALALASTELARTPDRQLSIVLFTDGAWPVPDSVGQLAAPVEIVLTGGGSNNQAIAAAVVRMDPTGRGQVAFIDIANESDGAARAPMQLLADGAPLDSREVQINARSDVQLSIPLPSDVGHITVQLTGHDALALDDKLDVLAPGGPTREVDVLGRASDGLQRALESIPWLHVRTAHSSTPPDLTVLAGVFPARLPRGPLLLVDPPSGSARLPRVEASDPLLRGVDLTALAGLTLMRGTLEGQPVVSMTLDPGVTGLEKSLAFPLLVSNATSYLLAQTDPLVAAASAEIFDPAESDIRPRPVPTFTAVAATSNSVGVVEYWPWLAAAAVGLLAIEWVVFARRG